MVAEKGLTATVRRVEEGALPTEVAEISPSGELPVMIDRDLRLHGAGVIVDYLDERYPHPPFMPMDPVSRAQCRQAAHRIQQDWYPLAPRLGDSAAATRQRAEQLSQALAAANPVFAAKPYFLSDSYSVLDAMLAPLLWRLAQYGIVMGEQVGAHPAALVDYTRRMHARPAFRASLELMSNENGE